MIEKLQVAQVFLTSQQEACGFNEYVMRVDAMMSHWDVLAGAGANAITDVIVAFVDPNQSMNTPIVKAWDALIIPAFAGGINAADWEMFGQGIAQFISALVKFEAADNFLDVDVI